MNILQFTKKRILLLLLLLLIVLIAGAGLVFLNLGKVVNSNKDRILAKAEEILGRKVSVGTIDVTLWTGVGVKLSQFSIADDPAYSNESFVGAENLDIYFKLMPLFRKQLEISHLSLQRPVFRVVQNKDGQYNFSTLLARKTAEKPGEATTQKSDSPSSGFSLALLEISDGLIDYRSEKTKQEIRLSRIDGSIRDFSLDKPFSVKLDAACLGDQKNLSMNGKIGPLGAAGQKQSVNGDIQFHALSLPVLAQLPFLQSKSMQYDGTIDGEAHLEGNLDNLKVNVTLNGDNSALTYNKQYEKPKGVPFQISTESNYTGESINLQKFNVKLAVLDVEGKGTIELGKTPATELSLQSKPVDISWLATLRPELKSYNLTGKTTIQAVIKQKGDTPQLDGNLSLENAKAQIPNLVNPIGNLNGKISFNLQTAKTDGVSFQIGESKLNLQSEASSFSPLALKFNAASDKLTLGDLIKTSEAMKNDVLEKTTFSGTFSSKNGGESSGVLASDKGMFYGLNYTNLNSPYNYENKILAFNNLSLKTLNGEIQGKARYDMQQTPPKFEASTQTMSIDLAELIRTKVSWFPQFVQGKVNLNLDLAGSGNTWDVMKPTLKGNGSVSISDGMLMNVNLADKLLSGLSGMPGIANFITSQYKEEYPRVFASEHTIFQDLKLEAAIQDGKIDFKNLLITASDWVVNGEGSMGFGESMQSDALLRLSKDFTSFLTGKVSVFKYLTDDNGNMSIPFSMTGILPTIKPAPRGDLLTGLLQKALTGQVTDKLNLKGMPGFSNLLQLPFDTGTGSKKKQNLPEIPADKISAQKAAASAQTKTATQETSSATRTTSPSRQSAEMKAASAEITRPTKITPKDVLNPLLKLLDKKK